MYYKYRDLKNYKYLLDIFLNQRLYSASFRNLNDNFEGQFLYDFSKGNQRTRLNPVQQEHISICSFSKSFTNHLMWSHYADGHRGVVIGFEIDELIYKIEKVCYDGLIICDELPKKFDELKKVFLNKINDWKYEEEYRIITEKQDFINIQIKEVILGAETPEEDKIIIKRLAELINNNIKIETYYG
jgi:hypothetical protein